MCFCKPQALNCKSDIACLYASPALTKNVITPTVDDAGRTLGFYLKETWSLERTRGDGDGWFFACAWEKDGWWWWVMHDLLRDLLKFVKCPYRCLTGIQLVAHISATSPHHFFVLCHIFTNFWRKTKLIVIWKAENLARQSRVVVKQRWSIY
jgi:hypothetical protein